MNKDTKISEEIFPGMLKTRRMGYDGKGQSVVNSKDDLVNIDMNIPYILEKKINLLKEPFNLGVPFYKIQEINNEHNPDQDNFIYIYKN